MLLWLSAVNLGSVDESVYVYHCEAPPAAKHIFILHLVLMVEPPYIIVPYNKAICNAVGQFIPNWLLSA